jgi:Na+/H+ antiporter NhaD/arsenite permease-like protein
MAYAIITGAHLFPYAWFYDEIGYAIAAILISVGALVISLSVEPGKIYFIPIYTAVILLLLGIWIYVNYMKLRKKHER